MASDAPLLLSTDYCLLSTPLSVPLRVAAEPLVNLFVGRVAAEFSAEAFGSHLALVARGVRERVAAGGAPGVLTFIRAALRPRPGRVNHCCVPLTSF